MPSPGPPAESPFYIDLPDGGGKLFVDFLFSGPDAPNIISACSPVTSVTRFRLCYEPLTARGFNVFALDFAGFGQSESQVKYFTLESLVRDFELLVDHLAQNYSGPVFLFGDTGTGGIFAQHYAAARGRVRALAQYGVCRAGDCSPLKYPRWRLELAYLVLKTLRRAVDFALPLSPPAYDGFNAEKENAFYASLLAEDPGMFKIEAGVVISLMRLFLGRAGFSQKDIKIPTLVFPA